MRKRKGDYLQTASGKRFWVLDPKSSEVDIRDIAWQLSNTCRYRGAVSSYYSVAEHSVLVSEYVPPECAREALLHDAAEAYIGDMVRPLKHQPSMKPFRDAEAKLEAVIFKRFGIKPTEDSREHVKEVDNRILCDETAAFMRNPSWSRASGYYPLNCDPQGLDPYKAYLNFMTRFNELFPEEVQLDTRRVSKASAKDVVKRRNARGRLDGVSSVRGRRRAGRIR